MARTLESIVLRKPEPEDVGPLYAFRNDSEVVALLGGFSTGYSHDDLRQWIERRRGRNDEVINVIADRQTNRCLGHVGLYKLEPRLRSAEFAILIGDKRYWGKGIGKQASIAMIRFGFEELNLHKISLTVLANNARAIQLYERIGFRRDAVLRDEQFRGGRYIDVILMSMLDSEYRSLYGAE